MILMACFNKQTLCFKYRQYLHQSSGRTVAGGLEELGKKIKEVGILESYESQDSTLVWHLL